MENMRIEIGNSSEAYLKRAFSWLTRIGAAPAFGSRPIGWYQVHQMNCLNWLEKSKAAGLPVRCKGGIIQAKPTIGHWFDVVSATELYRIGDAR